jgi:hypothetical protein|tara:strand:+ start:4691 stop:5203 length:513 start_codon:yes stop_codon:yes gene_type:complete
MSLYVLKMSKYEEEFHIGTTRFTNETFEENKKWREKHNWKGCIYGLSKRVPLYLGSEALIYVVEMNNDTNQIEGVGLIRNYINKEKRTWIYNSDTSYNRFIYNSAFRLDKGDFKHHKTIELLETILFYGSGHYKRGKGITVIDWKKMHSRVIKVLRKYFKSLFSSPNQQV